MVYIINDNNVKELLESNDIKFKSFETVIDAFCDEEATYRIDQFEDDFKEKFTEEAKDKLQCNLSNIYNDNNESFINSDELYNLSCNEIDDFIESHRGKMQIFMTRE